MAIPNKMAALVCTGLVVSTALISAAAQPQDVSFIARRDFDTDLYVFSYPSSVAVGDFNSDGVPDLAVTNTFSSDVSVLLGNGNGSFQPARNLMVGSIPLSVAVGDFNGDGVQDLAVANNGSNNVSVLLSNGDGTFQPARNFAAGNGPNSVAGGGFNGAGRV